MKKLYFTAACFLIFFTSNAQFYNKLNNIFLEKTQEESIFSADLMYVRSWLQTIIQKVFMADFQNSNSTSGNSSFFSMQIIPRGKTVFSILDSGISINLDDSDGKSISKIPLTFSENINVEDKSGNGFSQIDPGKIKIEFSRKVLLPIDDETKIEKIDPEIAKFIVDGFDYKITNDLVIISIKGKMDSAFKTVKSRKKIKTCEKMIFEFSKSKMKVSLFIYNETENIIIKEMDVNK